MDIEVTPNSSLPTNSPHENSALILLLKKLATTTSNLFDGVLDSLPYESLVPSYEGGLFGMYSEEFGAAELLSDVFLPYLSPMLRLLLPEEEQHPPLTESQAESIPSATEASNVTEKNAKQDGLVPPTLDIIDRLEYVITQMDISRMERLASKRLDVNIHDLPTVVYGNDLICPPYEEDTDPSDAEEHFENDQWMSWMVVPRDEREDTVRISERRGVPESISICSSKSGAGRDTKEFDCCVICKEMFREGECLRVLPCEHLLHSTCICSSEVLKETFSGCPMCKNKTAAISLRCLSNSRRNGREQVEKASSFHSDGSVPSWAFVQLGSLMSSKESKEKGLHHDW